MQRNYKKQQQHHSKKGSHHSHKADHVDTINQQRKKQEYLLKLAKKQISNNNQAKHQPQLTFDFNKPSHLFLFTLCLFSSLKTVSADNTDQIRNLVKSKTR